MCDMTAMPMPGMRMPGGPGSAASFVAMWILMMGAMMLPVLVPMLKHYRDAVREPSAGRRAVLIAIVSGGYFLVWTVAGVVVFAGGTVLATIGMRNPTSSNITPLAASLAVIAAGAMHFTAAKARHLACCRERSDTRLPSDAGTAWRHGLQLGVRCVRCCANLTAILIALGAMDLVVMVLVTAAISAERLSPAGVRAARATGVAAVLVGLMLAAG
jgi:predicted metal-binding membrane protein